MLCNVSHKHYSKRDLRQAALSMIALQMQENCGCSMTADQVSSKIASIRTYYGRELRKVTGAQKSGASSSDLYVSQWEFFSMLDPLLRGQVQKRPSVSNMLLTEKDTPEPVSEHAISDLPTSESPTPECSDADIPTKSVTEDVERPPWTVAVKKRKQTEDSDVNSGGKNAKVNTSTDSDCDLLFGKQVGLEIKQISDQRKRQELKLKIQKLIFDYQF